MIIPLLQSHRDWRMMCETFLIVLRNNRESHCLVNKLKSADWLLKEEKQFNRLLRGKGIFCSACLLLLCFYVLTSLDSNIAETSFFFLSNILLQIVFFCCCFSNSRTAYQEIRTFLHRQGVSGVCHLLMKGILISPRKNKVKENCTSLSQTLMSCLKSLCLREQWVKTTCYLSYKTLGACSKKKKRYCIQITIRTSLDITFR